MYIERMRVAEVLRLWCSCRCRRSLASGFADYDDSCKDAIISEGTKSDSGDVPCLSSACG